MDLSSGRFGSLSNQNSTAQSTIRNNLVGPPPPPTASGAATHQLRPQPVPRLRQARQRYPGQQPVVPVPASGVVASNLSAAMEKLVHCHDVQGKNNDELKKALGDVLVEFSSMKIQLDQQQISIAHHEIKIQEQETSQRETEKELKQLQLEKLKFVNESARVIDNLNFQLKEKEQEIESLNVHLKKKCFNNQKLKKEVADQAKKVEEQQNDYRAAVEQSHKKEIEHMQANAELRVANAKVIVEQEHLAQQLEMEKAERKKVQLKMEKKEEKLKQMKDGMTMMLQNQAQQQQHQQQEYRNFMKNFEDENDAGSISAGAIANSSKKRKMNASQTSTTPGHGCDGDNDTTTSPDMDDQNCDLDEYALQIVETETDEQDVEENIHAN